MVQRAPARATLAKALALLCSVGCAEEEILAPITDTCASWTAEVPRTDLILDIGPRVALLGDVALAAWAERAADSADLSPTRLMAAIFERRTGALLHGPLALTDSLPLQDAAVVPAGEGFLVVGYGTSGPVAVLVGRDGQAGAPLSMGLVNDNFGEQLIAEGEGALQTWSGGMHRLSLDEDRLVTEPRESPCPPPSQCLASTQVRDEAGASSPAFLVMSGAVNEEDAIKEVLPGGALRSVQVPPMARNARGVHGFTAVPGGFVEAWVEDDGIHALLYSPSGELLHGPRLLLDPKAFVHRTTGAMCMGHGSCVPLALVEREGGFALIYLVERALDGALGWRELRQLEVAVRAGLLEVRHDAPLSSRGESPFGHHAAGDGEGDLVVAWADRGQRSWTVYHAFRERSGSVTLRRICPLPTAP